MLGFTRQDLHKIIKKNIGHFITMMMMVIDQTNYTHDYDDDDNGNSLKKKKNFLSKWIGI